MREKGHPHAVVGVGRQQTLDALFLEERTSYPKRSDEAGCLASECYCASSLSPNSAHRQPPSRKKKIKITLNYITHHPYILS